MPPQVVSLLHRNTIYRLEVENDVQAMTIFVLRRRKAGTSPTHAERMAVALACKVRRRGTGDEGRRGGKGKSGGTLMPSGPAGRRSPSR